MLINHSNGICKLLYNDGDDDWVEVYCRKCDSKLFIEESWQPYCLFCCTHRWMYTDHHYKFKLVFEDNGIPNFIRSIWC